jgi:hypothetical protein
MKPKVSQGMLNRIRILTLNLWQRYGEWAERRSVLIEGIRAKQPDLVAFAESIKTGEYDQTVDLLGEGFNVAHSSARDTNGMGISIASRWPIQEVQEVDLNVTSRTAGFPCTALVATVGAPDPIGSLLFVNHFPNWQLNFEHERELQAIATARFVEERVGQSNQPVTACGLGRSISFIPASRSLIRRHHRLHPSPPCADLIVMLYSPTRDDDTAARLVFMVVGLKAARVESASQDHKRSRGRCRCIREFDQQRAPNCPAKVPASYRLAPVLSSRAL